ncbi:sensor histidine kinase [Longispora sp. NPDC051575]|uniref:sensor histidine kinase n=1 Tax=Longispora sp. NPDC051575 TaxID=3154943 RepID=UPI003446F92D
MTSSRPVPWVSPVLYAAVLVAGLYAGVRGLGDTHLVLFAGGIAALFALELVEARGRGRAALLLAARAVLFLAVAAADGSGLSRALFVLVPFTAYFAFGRAVALALGAGCLGLVLVGHQVTSPGWTTDLEKVSDLLMFALGLVLAVTMAAVAVEERAGRHRLEESHRRIADLSAAAERTRIARDIHDDVGHHLTAVLVLLEKATAFRDRDPDLAREALGDAERSARRALEDVRRSVRTLHAEPGPFRLTRALDELVGDSVPVRVTGDEDRYGEETLRVLFRAAQEGITNARRHARATAIEVLVDFGADRARLTIGDDGRGFAPGAEGFGLRGLRDRVERVGGRLDVAGGPAGGTRLVVTVPGGARRPVPGPVGTPGGAP